jgi:DNA polymerase IV (archaeal DinB-like DNA polymerase)
VIGCLDLDYFYAQVEEVGDPSIKSRPVMVCVFSGRSAESGVVATSNYVARSLGVKSGAPIALAKKKLEGKDPVVIKMDYEKYQEVSTRVMDLVADRVDILERTGIDEAFFDLTLSSEGDFGRAEATARRIKDAIVSSERLTCSIGLGASKVVAKLASDISKPNGLKVVRDEETASFLQPLQVGMLYGVGPKTAGVLDGAGIKTVGELARADFGTLEGLFGRGLAHYLSVASTGRDSEPVRPRSDPKQFSRIVTLKRDTNDPEEIVAQLSSGLDSVYERLVSTNQRFKTISALGITTDLSIRTRSRTLRFPTSDKTMIVKEAGELFRELTAETDKQLRRAGVRISGLERTSSQSTLSDLGEGS